MTNVSNAESLPASYIYLIRFFIAAYCSFSFFCATTRSLCAFVISSPVWINSLSSVLTFPINVVSCDCNELTSFCFAAFSFFKSSTDGAARTGVTIIELVTTAVINLIPCLFILTLLSFCFNYCFPSGARLFFLPHLIAIIAQHRANCNIF